uniref:Uncharacterized protein n=1 Tax=Picea sitchensis TaxID=3332 RepID=B8LP37_PICSI|nr:unknown [Picea sitchensis]
MFTNPFERKHSALRQALDRFIGKEAKLGFRRKKDGHAKIGATVSGSTSSVASSSISDFVPRFAKQR